MATSNMHVRFDEKAHLMVITIDTAKRYGKSKSGITDIIASTDGFAFLSDPSQGEVRLNLSLVQKPARAADPTKPGRAPLTPTTK